MLAPKRPQKLHFYKGKLCVSLFLTKEKNVTLLQRQNNEFSIANQVPMTIIFISPYLL